MSIKVIQSHRSPLPHSWLVDCLASVKAWSKHCGYHYEFVGDALFGYLPEDIWLRQDISLVIKTDLARLKLAQSLLSQHDVVVWLDADVLVVNVDQFVLPTASCAVGRENWQQLNDNGVLKNYRKVHNAAMLFTRNDSFLPFYADTAERLLRENTQSVPPQFIGPKLLTALHNVAQLPVWESAGMLSPMAGLDIIGQGDGRALKMLREKHQEPINALNLCSSSVVRCDLSDADMAKIIEKLLANKGI